MVSGSEKLLGVPSLVLVLDYSAVKHYRAVSAISREDADYPSRSVKQILLADLWDNF